MQVSAAVSCGMQKTIPGETNWPLRQADGATYSCILKFKLMLPMSKLETVTNIPPVV